jgi:hypothetical protein
VKFHWTQVTSPDMTCTLPRFECPADWSEQYATRVSGYLHPPVSGKYTFWIASDDGSELYLATTREPASKKKIAEVTDWTDNCEWDKFPSQKSAPVVLEKGKTYYIEALQVEGGGGDNLAVAWQYPGQECTVIDGRYLSPAGTGKGKTGSITRDVWNNVTETTVKAFLQSPRIKSIPKDSLSDPGSHKTTFVPAEHGTYLFKLTVTDGKRTASDLVAVRATSSLENGDFESGSGTAPEHWTTGSREIRTPSSPGKKTAGSIIPAASALQSPTRPVQMPGGPRRFSWHRIRRIS